MPVGQRPGRWRAVAHLVRERRRGSGGGRL